MSDAARLAAVIVRVIAVCMMAIGPVALVAQAIIGPGAFTSARWIATMLGGAALYMLPGYILYRVAPRVGRFVARGLD